MRTIELNERELQLYRDALDADEAHTGPSIPKECYHTMAGILRRRGLVGFPEKVTIEFRGCSKIYELHFSSAHAPDIDYRNNPY